MNQQDVTRFENYARSCGYSTNKEGGRYCQGIVNQLRDAWCAAREEIAGAPTALQQRYAPSRTRSPHRLLSN